MVRKQSTRKRIFEQSAMAAERFITLFHQVDAPNEEQRMMLATAYYTLALQPDISLNRSKMHVNSAIALLQNIKKRKDTWESQIAHAYFKRAELLEEEYNFMAATVDYQRAMEILEHCQSSAIIIDPDRLLVAQCAISMAALIVHNQIDTDNLKLNHPLYYINKSLEYLGNIADLDEEIFKTLCYAHQVAGIALSHDFEDAKKAFQTAISMAYQIESPKNYAVLSDIYSYLGLLYEQHYHTYPIQTTSYATLDEAMIYFGLSLLFNPIYPTDDEELLGLEQLFEIIYRLLDPYLEPVAEKVLIDLIDALITLSLGILEGNFPSESLKHQLSNKETFEIFKQHIYWLISEAHRRTNPNFGLYEISDPKTVDLSLDLPNIIATLENKIPNNVHYLEKNLEKTH